MDPYVLRFLTFNLRTWLAMGDGPNHWTKRRDDVLATILDSKPDFAALQEMSPPMWGDLEPHLDSWQLVKGWAEGGPRATGLGLLIRKDYQLHATGQFWLSDTPHLAESISFTHDWGPRIVLWAQVEGPYPQGVYYVMATHFDTNSASSLPAGRVAVEQINKIAGQDRPVWLMGDFNSAGGSQTWDFFMENGFRDAWRQTGQSEKGNFTFHQFSGQDVAHKGRIDWILHRGPWVAWSCKIDRRHKKGFYPSDHFPFSAVYKLEA